MEEVCKNVNTTIAGNADLRQRIEALRKERCLRDLIFRQLEGAITQEKNRLLTILARNRYLDGYLKDREAQNEQIVTEIKGKENGPATAPDVTRTSVLRVAAAPRKSNQKVHTEVLSKELSGSTDEPLSRQDTARRPSKNGGLSRRKSLFGTTSKNLTLSKELTQPLDAWDNKSIEGKIEFLESVFAELNLHLEGNSVEMNPTMVEQLEEKNAEAYREFLKQQAENDQLEALEGQLMRRETQNAHNSHQIISFLAAESKNDLKIQVGRTEAADTAKKLLVG